MLPHTHTWGDSNFLHERCVFPIKLASSGAIKAAHYHCKAGNSQSVNWALHDVFQCISHTLKNQSCMVSQLRLFVVVLWAIKNVRKKWFLGGSLENQIWFFYWMKTLFYKVWHALHYVNIKVAYLKSKHSWRTRRTNALSHLAV